MAAGPCATCGRPVCGECCTLTEGGVKVWAVCLDCDRRNRDAGRSLSRAWGGLAVWLVGILVALALAVAALEFIASRMHG